MKTLKLFLLSLICGHPLSFLADFIRIRLAKSVVEWSDEKDLILLMDYYQKWDPCSEEMEFDEPEEYYRRTDAFTH